MTTNGHVVIALNDKEASSDELERIEERRGRSRSRKRSTSRSHSSSVSDSVFKMLKQFCVWL